MWFWFEVYVSGKPLDLNQFFPDGDWGFRIADCGFRIEKNKVQIENQIRIPHSQTGNPPAGWESEGQIYNLKSKINLSEVFSDNVQNLCFNLL